MKTKWAEKYSKCQQCGTNRFNHKAKGFCKRCYPLIKRLEHIEQWDMSNLKTLKGYPPRIGFSDPYIFKQVKRGVAAQIREHLAILKAREEILQGEIDGIDVECLLRDIAHRCGVRNKDLLLGIAGYIDSSFDIKKKKILFELLNEIAENIPRKGIDWNRVFQRNRSVKFFVPPFEDEETALKNYQGIKKFAQQNLGWGISERRIYKIIYNRNGKDCVAEVGKPDPNSGELISAILESNAYLICTTTESFIAD